MINNESKEILSELLPITNSILANKFEILEIAKKQEEERLISNCIILIDNFINEFAQKKSYELVNVLSLIHVVLSKIPYKENKNFILFEQFKLIDIKLSI